MTATELARQTVEIVRSTVLYKRQMWGPLLGRERQFEGWWKAELAGSIESWTWQAHLAESFDVWPEARPRDFGVGKSKNAVDLLVVPYDEEADDFVYSRGPRTWIELKTRGTWWGGPAKGLGRANSGLHYELCKWKNTPWKSFDGVYLAHLIVHDGDEDEVMAPSWERSMDEVRASHELASPTLSVGFPIPRDGVRWVTLDVFTLHAPG